MSELRLNCWRCWPTCQSGTWGAPKIQFTTQTYNIAKNTRNLRLGVHAYCSW
ncbi:shufflon protein C, partial [Escherichia coli]|nr:shufflon protein C [Escherichia coli]